MAQEQRRAWPRSSRAIDDDQRGLQPARLTRSARGSGAGPDQCRPSTSTSTGTGADQARSQPAQPHPAPIRRGRSPSPTQPSRNYCASDTEDMLKPSTRIGGMALRVNQSLHSRDRAGSVRPTSDA